MYYIWSGNQLQYFGLEVRGDENLKYYQQQTFDGIGLTLHATWTYVTLNVFGSFIAISDFMEVIWSSLSSSQQTFRNLDIIKPRNCAMETLLREYHHFSRELSASLRTCLVPVPGIIVPSTMSNDSRILLVPAFVKFEMMWTDELRQRDGSTKLGRSTRGRGELLAIF